MSRHEDMEYDRIIGTAVIALLEERVPVTNDSLLSQLHTLLLSEENGFDEMTVRWAIHDISAAIAQRAHLSRDSARVVPVSRQLH